MMNTRFSTDGRSLAGFGLLGLGVLLLLGNLGIFHFISSLFWGAMFLLGAASFGLVFITNRNHWWALFPTAALGAIGAMIMLEGLLPWFDFGWIILGALSAAFWGVYLNRPQHWWAMIPGGVLGTVAVVVLFGKILPFLPTGAIMLYGLAATFGLVTVLARQKWAIIPAGVLAIVGTTVFVGSMMRWLFPLALIGIGVLLFNRNRNN